MLQGSQSFRLRHQVCVTPWVYTHMKCPVYIHTHTPVQEPVLHGFKRWEDTIHDYFSLLHDTFLAMGINPRPGSPEITSSSLGRKPDFLSSSGLFSFLTLSHAFTRGLRRMISKASNTMTWSPSPERLSLPHQIQDMNGWQGDMEWRMEMGRKLKEERSHQWSSNQFSPFLDNQQDFPSWLGNLNCTSSLIFSYSPSKWWISMTFPNLFLNFHLLVFSNCNNHALQFHWQSLFFFKPELAFLLVVWRCP